MFHFTNTNPSAQTTPLSHVKPQKVYDFIVWFPTIQPHLYPIVSEMLVQTSLPSIQPNPFGVGAMPELNMVFTLDAGGDVLSGIRQLFVAGSTVQIDLIDGNGGVTDRFWVSGEAVKLDFDVLDTISTNDLHAFLTFSCRQAELNGLSII